MRRRLVRVCVVYLILQCLSAAIIPRLEQVQDFLQGHGSQARGADSDQPGSYGDGRRAEQALHQLLSRLRVLCASTVPVCRWALPGWPRETPRASCASLRDEHSVMVMQTAKPWMGLSVPDDVKRPQARSACVPGPGRVWGSWPTPPELSRTENEPIGELFRLRTLEAREGNHSRLPRTRVV